MLLYQSSVGPWFLASSVASCPLPVDYLLKGVVLSLALAPAFSLLWLCSLSVLLPACSFSWGYTGLYIGYVCYIAFWCSIVSWACDWLVWEHGMTISLELVIGWFESMGWHYLLSLWLAGLRAWNDNISWACDWLVWELGYKWSEWSTSTHWRVVYIVIHNLEWLVLIQVCLL